MKVTTIEEKEALEEMTAGMAGILGPTYEAFGAGFMLAGFEFGEGGWSTYCSNAQRPDMIRFLRKMADTLEMELDVPAIAGDRPTAQKTGGSA